MTDLVLTPLLDGATNAAPSGTPHLAYPFRMLATAAGAAAATVPQDSAVEVAQCVYAIVGTRPGDRDDFPDMGIEDPTFHDLDLEDVRTQVEDYEPRAEMLSDSQFDGLVQRVRLTVAVR